MRIRSVLADAMSDMDYDADLLSADMYATLDVLTDTLRNILSLLVAEDNPLRTMERCRGVFNTVLWDTNDRARLDICRLIASELHCLKFVQRNSSDPIYRASEYLALRRGTSSPHKTGVLASLPNLTSDVAVFEYAWLVFGSGVSPEQCCYPALPADVRWMDMFVRCIDPAAEMVTASRIDLPTLPEFKRAVKALEENDVDFVLTEEDTVLGEKGFNFFVPLETVEASSMGDRKLFVRSLAISDESWREPVEACRQRIAEAKVQEGLTEEPLFDIFKKRFPERNTWSSLDAALADKYHPFPFRDDAPALLAEALLADLWNEYFGQLAIQWEVMQLYDRIVEPDDSGFEPMAVVKRIERTLHSSIFSTLKRRFGTDEWWVEGVPDGIRKKCAEIHEDDKCRYPKESYTYFIDLAGIVTKKENWARIGQIFESVLGVSGKNGAESWFGKLNRLRNHVFHPVKGNLSDDELDYLLDCDRLVSVLTTRLDAADPE